MALGSREMDFGVSSLPPFSFCIKLGTPAQGMVPHLSLSEWAFPLQFYPPEVPSQTHTESTVQGNLNHTKVTVKITHCTGQSTVPLSCNSAVAVDFWIYSMSPIRWNTVFCAWLPSFSMVFVEFICVVAGLLFLLLFVVEWKDYNMAMPLFSHSFHQLVHIFSVSKQTLL